MHTDFSDDGDEIPFEKVENVKFATGTDKAAKPEKPKANPVVPSKDDESDEDDSDGSDDDDSDDDDEGMLAHHLATTRADLVCSGGVQRRY